MISAMVFDFSNVLIFSKDRNYRGLLTSLHHTLQKEKGYSVLDRFDLNEELLAYLETIHEHYELYLFTASTIQEQKEIRERLDKIFREIFSSTQLGLSKQDPNAFFQIAELIQHYPSEILFIDDTVTNVMAAEEAGYLGVHYENNDQLLSTLQQLISREGRK